MIAAGHIPGSLFEPIFSPPVQSGQGTQPLWKPLLQRKLKKRNILRTQINVFLTDIPYQKVAVLKILDLLKEED